MKPQERIDLGHYLVAGYDIHRVGERQTSQRTKDWVVVLNGELIGCARTMSDAREIVHDHRRSLAPPKAKIPTINLVVPRQGRLVHAARHGRITICGLTFSTGELREGLPDEVTCHRCRNKLTS